MKKLGHSIRNSKRRQLRLGEPSGKVASRRAVEVKYRTIFDATNDAIFIHDAKTGTILDVNAGMCRMYGYTPEEARSLTVGDLSSGESPYSQVDALSWLGKADASEPQTFEWHAKDKTGSLFWGEVSMRRVDMDGAERIVVVVRDITARKRAEEALRQSEAAVRNKLKALIEPEGGFGALSLADIIDAQELQAVMDEFYRLTHIGCAIIDLKGKVLVANGWQDICTKFHRCHPETLANCIESDTILSKGVPPGTYRCYRCKNNMWDMSTPIVVGGEHVGNIFHGQFFYEDEKLDIEFFRQQAARYGFDEKEYLEALTRVPRWSRETLDAQMMFYSKFAAAISRLSYSTVKLARTLAERDRTAALLNATLESSNDGVLVVDKDSRITLHNQRFLDIWRIPAALVAEHDDRKLLQFVLAQLKTPQTFIDRVQYLYENPAESGMDLLEFLDGRVFERWSAPQIVDGAVAGRIWVFHDITELKRNESELEQHRHHLEQLVAQRTAELEKAKDAAEAANSAKSAFLSNMSHELRTPMNAILGFTQIMSRDSYATEKQKENLGIILKSGEHLLALINDVLDLSKIESGKIEVEPQGFDLGTFTADLVTMLKVRAEAKGLQLILDQSSSFPRFVKTDPAKLRQIVINLVGNAIKFTQQGQVSVKLATIALEHDPNKLELAFEISDTGPGIAPDDLERIFRPFEQARQKTLSEGTGLGLAISREYINLLGGTVTVTSELGVGSTFRFTILCDAVEADHIPEIQKDLGIILSIANASNYKILVVEDQLENRFLLKTLLSHYGFQYREAVNGQEAVAAAQEWRPDLILMDRRMPVMNGLEATQEICALALNPSPVIVALTAHAYQEERQEMLDAGCADFLAKPFREQDLFDLLAKRLDIQVHYADTPTLAPAAQLLTPELFAGLTDDLREGLKSALTRLDMEAVAEAIAAISDQNPVLGEQLKREADSLAYSDILSAMKIASQRES